MFKKIIVSTLLLFSLFPFSSASALDASSQIPALNPFCWKKKDCFEMRAKYITGTATKEDLENGFVSGASAFPCVGGEKDNEWGRCLPAGKSVTEISFGGQNRFSHIGEFILLMYKYTVTIASIVAVIVIILAGVQWVTSAGSSEVINAAKKRIGGAVIGLFITYLSYFILNTINPALINLRMPQVWLIRPMHLVPEFCKQIATTDGGKQVKFVYYANYDDQKSPVKPENAGKDELVYGNYKDGAGNPMFYCGRRFLAEGSGTQTCFGGLCPSEPGNRQSCARDDNNSGLQCHKGELAIHLRIDIEAFDLGEQISQAVDKLNDGIFVTKAMETKWVYNTQVFRAVCKNIIAGGTEAFYLANNGAPKSWWYGDKRLFGPGGNSTGGGIPGDPYWEYQFYYTDSIDYEKMNWDCDHGGEVVGYLLRIETHARQSTWDKYKPSLTEVLIPGYGIGNAIYKFLFDDGPQPNLNIGYDRSTGQPVFGTFPDDVKTIANYIPIDLLKEGLSLDINLTISKLIKMKGKPGSTPMDSFLNTVPFPKPEVQDLPLD